MRAGDTTAAPCAVIKRASRSWHHGSSPARDRSAVYLCNGAVWVNVRFWLIRGLPRSPWRRYSARRGRRMGPWPPGGEADRGSRRRRRAAETRPGHSGAVDLPGPHPCQAPDPGMSPGNVTAEAGPLRFSPPGRGRTWLPGFGVSAGCGLGRHLAVALDEAARILAEVSQRARAWARIRPGPAAVGNHGPGWRPCWPPSALSTRPVASPGQLGAWTAQEIPGAGSFLGALERDALTGERTVPATGSSTVRAGEL